MRIEDARRQAITQPTRPAIPRTTAWSSADPRRTRRTGSESQAVEKAYASMSYTDVAEARDHRQLAVLSVPEDIRQNENQLKNRSTKEN
ncbi:hypothetical protein [Streptomyces sp. NPDC054804]